jgi:uncharacterized RDD family membrane protein YckC
MPAMSDEWYYAQQGRQLGPVALERLRELLANGQVTRSDLVWRAGMANWADAGSVGELAGDQAPPAAVVTATLPYSAAPIQYFNPTGAVFVYGGFWLRFCAWFIDWIILTIATQAVVVTLPSILRLGVFNFGRPMPVWTLGMAVNIPSALIGWLYYALLESSTMQATVGKMALGLVVRDLEGRRISFARATGRHFGKIISTMILGIGYIMAGFTEKKQALHDIIANTLVVRKSLPRG